MPTNPSQKIRSRRKRSAAELGGRARAPTLAQVMRQPRRTAARQLAAMVFLWGTLRTGLYLGASSGSVRRALRKAGVVGGPAAHTSRKRALKAGEELRAANNLRRALERAAPHVLRQAELTYSEVQELKQLDSEKARSMLGRYDQIRDRRARRRAEMWQDLRVLLQSVEKVPPDWPTRSKRAKRPAGGDD